MRRFYQTRCNDEQQRNSRQQLMSLVDITDGNSLASNNETNNETISSVELNMNENVSDDLTHVESEQNLEVNDVPIVDNNCSSTISNNDVFLYTVNRVFQKSLASAFIKCNLTHSQGNIILNILRSHKCHTFLPKDTRSLLNTPRDKTAVRSIYPGQYLHIGFETSINNILKKTSPNQIPSVLEIDWSTDGAKVNKCGTMQIWPIQISISNISYSKPEVVGIYIGKKKPGDINLFMDEFVTDVLQVLERGSIIFNYQQIPITLRAFIADAPARSWLLNHYGHTLSHACGKCKVVGVRYEQRMIFLGTNHRLRTDEEYIRITDRDHHKGTSPLSRLPMEMVTQVPVDYMHLVCIGVVKKLLTAWITGKYGKKAKLSGRNIDVVSKRLELLSHYCPRDFARKPRSLSDYSDYKATEGRQFILYTGPVVMLGIMEKQTYTHFLFLHSAIRMLCSNTFSNMSLLQRAEVALKKFIEKCQFFYKLTFMSYNVHALLHLVTDVKRFGPLDSFSAFKYENNMQFFRRSYRKPHQALQQFALRQAEINNRKKELCSTSTNVTVTQVFDRHSEGPLPLELLPTHCRQYTKIQIESMFFNVTSLGDKCCILKDSLVCVIENILEINETYHFVIKKFEIVEDFYDVGILSSSLDIYKCSALSSDLYVISITEVQAKCYMMLSWKVIDDEGSDSSSDSETDKPVDGEYIVSVLL
ncbi:uncharacterized protein LOC113006034 isoform X2 [Solenopsis invicta]|nr:uncharacterized protein LOC113006034 isoform X2 [Solenopsis invicta]